MRGRMVAFVSDCVEGVVIVRRIDARWKRLSITV